MVPSVSSAIMESLKTLQPGNCIAFGSAFKVPTAMHIERPNPEPLSNSANIQNIWYQPGTFYQSATTTYQKPADLAALQASLTTNVKKEDSRSDLKKSTQNKKCVDFLYDKI